MSLKSSKILFSKFFKNFFTCQLTHHSHTASQCDHSDYIKVAAFFPTFLRFFLLLVLLLGLLLLLVFLLLLVLMLLLVVVVVLVLFVLLVVVLLVLLVLEFSLLLM